MSTTGQARRRQARGERRIALLLDAAAEVFAEAGYEAATTNAIAARAGVSPGSLYQFFANKEALAEALAARFAAQLDAIYAGLPLDAGRVSVDVVVGQLVDPLVAFNVANPAFQALLTGSETPPCLAATARLLHESALNRVDMVLAKLAPQLPAEDRRRHAVVCKHLCKALLPLILATDGLEREQLGAELQSVLRGYLAPLAATA